MQNETLFREVNERVQELAVAFGGDADELLSGFVCECGRDHCVEIVQVSRTQYEAVRSDPCRFVILPGHEDPEVERVVERRGRYWIVEKFGEAGEIAIDQDSRS